MYFMHYEHCNVGYNKHKSFPLAWSRFLQTLSSIPAAMRVAPRPTHAASTAVKVPASKFVKFIRLMSNCYILPLRYSGDFSQVTFSILHWKTVLSTALVSIPLLLTVIWLGIVQWGFIPLYIERSLKVYTTFDFIITMIVVVNQINTITISR